MIYRGGIVKKRSIMNLYEKFTMGQKIYSKMKEGKEMKRKNIIYFVLILAMGILISGCSLSKSTSSESTKIEVLDFSQKVNLKKASKPIKEDANILFVGNSFTFCNDLPSTFLNLAESGGFTPNVSELSEGGYRLELFADPNDELGSLLTSALNDSKWDYVILQEQSRIPTFENMTEEVMYPNARKLDEMIKKADGQTVFFMTWAYKNGDNIDGGNIKVSTTREEMQTQLANSYIKIADELDAMMAPVGIAWMRAAEKYPNIELWDEALKHPSPAGTYLSACVFYGLLFDESPVGLNYYGDVEEETAKVLQQIAKDIIFQ
jgi:hypothetical protein